MKKVLLLGLATLFLAGCTQKTITTTTPAPETTTEEKMVPTEAAMEKIEEPTETTEETMTPWTITLGEQNKSEQQGLATLTEKDGKVVVTLAMSGKKSTVAQPAHIHMGACPTPGTVKFPLTDVKDGVSVTTLDTTFADLKKMEPLAINIHKSATDSKTYTSCGDVK